MKLDQNVNLCGMLKRLVEGMRINQWFIVWIVFQTQMQNIICFLIAIEMISLFYVIYDM